MTGSLRANRDSLTSGGKPDAMLDDRIKDRSITAPTTPNPRSSSKSNSRALTVGPPSLRQRAKNQTEDDISVPPLGNANYETLEPGTPTPLVSSARPSQLRRSKLDVLPLEILEVIIGHIVGHLAPVSGSGGGSSHSTRNWSSAMRHPRRRQLSDLAVVSNPCRSIVQERIYRHIKLPGTKAALEECGDWFLMNPHLQEHVRHFEILVPVLRTGQDSNATIEEIFRCAQGLFPHLCAVTIEAGHCKSPPQVQYFRYNYNRSRPPLGHAPHTRYHYTEATLDLMGYHRGLVTQGPLRKRRNTLPLSPIPIDSSQKLSVDEDWSSPWRIPTLPSTKTLILKGAWNLVRSANDFRALAEALPSFREFYCTYHKPKTGAYMAICNSLSQKFPPTITHLDLCLESLYTKNASSFKKWQKLYPKYHICRNIGALFPQLESLKYEGRVCGKLFSVASEAAESSARLKSIDIRVSNVCREVGIHNDGAGIHNWPFIQAFEALVLQATQALRKYPSLNSLRIHFEDLENFSAHTLNPRFHLDHNRAWGFWSPTILQSLREARPGMRFGLSKIPLGDLDGEICELSAWTLGIGTVVGLGGAISGPPFRTGKYLSVSLKHYKAMAHGYG